MVGGNGNIVRFEDFAIVHFSLLPSDSDTQTRCVIHGIAERLQFHQSILIRRHLGEGAPRVLETNLVSFYKSPSLRGFSS